MEQLADSN